MRIHCKVVALAVSLGVFLLFYFFGGNAADEPPPLSVQEQDRKLPSFPSASGKVSVEVFKPPEIPKQIRASRKEGYRGVNSSSKLR
ncbi:glucoside xylosyltransferase 2 [Tachysurus ichikawai]